MLDTGRPLRLLPAMPRRPDPPTLTANARRGWALAVLAGLALGAAGAAGVLAIGLAIGRAEPVFAILASVSGLVLLGLLGLEARTAWLLWREPDPILTIGPEGLWDRRLSPAPIPWAALDWQRVTVTQKRRAVDAVRFDTDAPERTRFHARLLARLNARFGYVPYAVMQIGLDTTTDAIAAACARHKPPGAAVRA